MSTSAQRERSGRRRLVALLVGVAVALIAFEVVLQIAAWWIFAHAGREQTAQGGKRVVLCVGDSFTYGLGASGPATAYPAQLQAVLDQRRPDTFAVINGGWPGQASDAVLRRLPGQLATHRPAVVVVLAGYNDQIKKPDPVVADEVSLDPGFPVHWRTGDLLARIWTALQGADELAGPTGIWVGSGVRLALQADGGADLNGEAATWSADGDRLVIGRDSGTLTFQWTRVGEVLVLRAPGVPGGELRLRAEGTPALAGENPTGRLLLEQALSDPETLDLAWVERTCAHLREHPEESGLWWRIVAAAGRGVGREQILATVEHALTLVDRDDPWRAALLRMRAGLINPGDPVGALSAVLEAALIDGGGFTVAAWLDQQGDRLDADSIAGAIDRLGPNHADRVRIDGMLTRAAAPAERTRAVLSDHLERIVSLCRRSGAEAILVTYPEPTAIVDGGIRVAARATDALLCDTVPRFTEYLAANPAAELFAPDRHCNDAGYRLVAAAVADALLR